MKHIVVIGPLPDGFEKLLAENAGVADLYEAYTELVKLVNPKDGEPPRGFRTLAETLVPAPAYQSQLEVAIRKLREKQDDLEGLTEALDTLEEELQGDKWDDFFTLITFEDLNSVEVDNFPEDDTDIRLVFTGLTESSVPIATKLQELIAHDGVSTVLYDSTTTHEELAMFIEGIFQAYDEPDVAGTTTDEHLAMEAVR